MVSRHSLEEGLREREQEMVDGKDKKQAQLTMPDVPASMLPTATLERNPLCGCAGYRLVVSAQLPNRRSTLYFFRTECTSLKRSCGSRSSCPLAAQQPLHL
jgi:hypothetical protein